jgi:archaellum biogenesis ATPase FlaH
LEIIKKIRESDSIVIEGDKKIGKMTLALYFSKLMNNKSTFISSLSSTKIIKKIESSVKSFECFKHLNTLLTIFSFREDWVNIKNEFGYKYLLKDLEYFISHQKNQIIIFHKIGSFFDYADRDFIEDFLSELLSYGITYKKKFIFTLNVDDINYDMLGHYLVDNSDLYLKLHKVESTRNIDILYSLTPISQQQYVFTSAESQIVLKPKSVYSGTNEDISIVVISSNPYLQQIHKYLLDKDNIELTIVDNISDSLGAILKNPDYLIFGQEDNEVKLSICELAKKNKLKTQILYLVNKDFVRVDDRMRAKELGCVDMIKLDENVMNYILELEKYFDLIFYKRSLTKHDIQYDDKNEFKAYIQEVINKRGIFTLVKINNVLNEEDYLSIRDYDKVLVTEEYSVIFTLNTLKSNIEIILQNKFHKELLIEKIQDSLDIFFEEKLCID